MFKNINTYYIIVILVLVGIILLQRSCIKSCNTTVVTKTDTIYRPIHDTTISYVPQIKEVLVEGKPVPIGIHDTTFSVTKENVDSATILYDYSLERYYADTVKTKYGIIETYDTVTQNKIKNRRMVMNWLIPTINNTSLIPQKNKVYVGLHIGTTGNTIGFGPQLLLQTKLDKVYGLGMDYIPNVGSYYHGSIFWKIHL